MAWEGAFGIVPAEANNCVMSGAFAAYEPIRSIIEPEFLNWYFRAPVNWQRIGRQSTGTNVRRKSLDPRLFESTLISLPPLPEQRRIVARIEELAAKVEEAQDLRWYSANECDAVMSARITGIFSTLTACRYIPISRLGMNDGNPIQIGPFGAQLHASEFAPKGVPVLNVGNVWPTGLRLDSLNYVTKQKAESLSRYAIKTDDLLFARSGATLGKVCLVPANCDGWLMTGHLFRVRFDPDVIDNRFAFSALRGARQVHEQIFGQVRGATRPGYNTTLLGAVSLPVPSLPEQRRIVAELDVLQAKVDAVKALQAETAAELEAMLPAILDKAFKGEL